MFDTPFEVWFEVEGRCNLSCKYCYCKYYSDRVLPVDNPIEVAERISSTIPIQSVTLTGGEPLLRSDLEEIANIFMEHDIPIIIASNGTLLTQERLHCLIGSGVRTFQIPILSPSSEIHNKLTGCDSWDDTVTSVIRSRESQCYTVIVFIATRYNLHEFIGVLEMAAILGISRVIFNKYIPDHQHLGSLEDDLTIQDNEQMITVLHKGRRFAQKSGIEITLGTPIGLNTKWQQLDLSLEGGQCTINQTSPFLTIDSSGNTRHCPLSDQIIGNMLHDAPEVVASRVIDGINQRKNTCSQSVCLHESVTESII